MESVYPLNVIVSNDSVLSQQYNDVIQSALFLSSCMQEENAAELFRNGAAVNKIILVDNAGENLVRALGQAYNWDSDRMPGIERVQTEINNDLTIHELHQLFEGDALKCGMG